MTMSHPDHDDAESTATIRRAVEGGMSMLDTADRYGAGHNERLVGAALDGLRDQVVLATKVGFVGRSGDARPVDGRPQHLRSAARASLSRLGVDHVDLLYLHRVDPQVDLEDSVGTLAELVGEGLTRHIGLSEVSSADLRRAEAVHPVAAVQAEYSLWSREPEEDLAAACAELGVQLVAYSPLGKGFLTGALRRPADIPAGNRLAASPRGSDDAFGANLRLVDELAEQARRLGCSPGQLALAWVTAHGAVPIPGCARAAHLEEALGALALSPPEEVLAHLDAVFDPTHVVGARKSPDGMALTRG